MPGESSAAASNMASTASVATSMESHSPLLGKCSKTPPMNKTVVHSVPVEAERNDMGEPESPGKGPNAAEALKALVNAEDNDDDGSSSSGSRSSGSGSGSGNRSSVSSDDDSASSGGEIDSCFRFLKAVLVSGEGRIRLLLDVGTCIHF